MKKLRGFRWTLRVGVLCLTFSSSSCETPAKAAPVGFHGDSLARFVRDPAPWIHLVANSEQCRPMYLGSTPRELALKLMPKDEGKPILVDMLRDSLQGQTRELRKALVAAGDAAPSSTLEFEAWPFSDDTGQPNWAYARWRETAGRKWHWFDSTLLSLKAVAAQSPRLPLLLDPTKRRDFEQIFDDVLKLKELYDKPLFGDCIWTDREQDNEVVGAWLPIDRREREGNRMASDLEHRRRIPLCRVLPQPARLNGQPVTFSLTVNASGVKWPEAFEWKSALASLPAKDSVALPITSWPREYTKNYRRDILALDGEMDAVFPLSGKTVRFQRKNSIDPSNQLLDVIRYLEERYRQLGIQTHRQQFNWRGIPQANLIAVIPGTGKQASLHPVIMADHIDTAFCEEVYEKSGRRISAPGADDNLSATGVLLQAAEVLRDRKFPHDIWLVHLTGEEFPADDLGANAFVSRLLRDRQDIKGLVLMDMIGHRESERDLIFQINPGNDATSLHWGTTALGVSSKMTRFEPMLRSRYDRKSYLYNTDGLVFSEAGYPVVYFNEHINRLENFFRKGYHHTTDTSRKMDWEYASDVGKVAIQTAAIMAGDERR